MKKEEIKEKVIESEKKFMELPYEFKIDNIIISKDDIIDWQFKEYKKTARLLNKIYKEEITNVDNQTFIQLKEAVIQIKMKHGQNSLRKSLKNKIKLGNFLTNLSLKLSPKKRKVSIADLYLKNCNMTASQISTSFFKMMTENNEINNFYNFKANPNHFYSQGDDKSQTVVEMTGGSRIPNLFTLIYNDKSGLISKKNPNFQFESAGTAKNSDKSIIIGGVRHLMTTNKNNMFHARLQVEFPAILPNFMIKQHAIHLLVEFSNWITDIQLKQEI